MPKEYIDREKALEATTYNPLVEPDPTDVIYLTLMTAQKNIRKIPAADVAPVVHGEWIVNPKREYDYICSVCGGGAPEDRWRNNAILTPYCPHCGAKMDGGNHEKNSEN